MGRGQEDNQDILYGEFQPRNADIPDFETQAQVMAAREAYRSGDHRPWCRLLGEGKIPDDYTSRANTNMLVPQMTAALDNLEAPDQELFADALSLFTGGQKCFYREETELLPLSEAILLYELEHGAASEYLPRKLDALLEQTSLQRPERQVLVAPKRDGYVHHVRHDDPNLTLCGKSINYTDGGSGWREQPGDVISAGCINCKEQASTHHLVRLRSETAEETAYRTKQMISRYVPAKIIDEAAIGTLRPDNAGERLRHIIWMQAAAFLDLECMATYDHDQRERAYPVVIGFGLSDVDDIPYEWRF